MSLISGILKEDPMEIDSKIILPWMIMRVWRDGWAKVVQRVQMYSYVGKEIKTSYAIV